MPQIEKSRETTRKIRIRYCCTLDLKIAALRKHASQFPDGWDPGDMLREWAAESGKEIGIPYAESFKRIILERERND